MRHRLLTLAVIAAAALVAVSVAMAGNLTATANVSGAAGVSLGALSNTSFNATLAGDDQIVSYSLPLSVVDARGLASGGGWNLTIASTAFDDGASHTLAAGSVTGATQACHSGSSCTLATNAVTYGVPLSSTAAKVFNAAANTGMGKVDVTPTVGVSIPGNAYAGTYTATVTVAAVAGP